MWSRKRCWIRGRLAGRGQLLRRVLADRVEHPEPGLAEHLGLAHHQGLVDQRGERVEDGGRGHQFVGAHLLGHLQRPARRRPTAAAAAPAPARSAGRGSSRWRPAASAAAARAARSPVVSSPNRSATRIRICSTDSARTRAAASSIASGMPSSDRQIAATAAALAGRQREAGRGRRRPGRRTAGPPPPRTRRRTRRPAAGPARRSRPPPAAARGWWRSAAGPARRPAAAGQSRAQASSRCSQLSSASTSERGAQRVGERVERAGGPSPRRRRAADATRATTRSGLDTSASSDVAGAVGEARRPSAASARSARRVLPMPPGPVSVTIRPANTSLRSSSSSCSRPTKLFGSVGRFRPYVRTSVHQYPDPARDVPLADGIAYAYPIT